MPTTIVADKTKISNPQFDDGDLGYSHRSPISDPQITVYDGAANNKKVVTAFSYSNPFIADDAPPFRFQFDNVNFVANATITTSNSSRTVATQKQGDSFLMHYDRILHQDTSLSFDFKRGIVTVPSKLNFVSVYKDNETGDFSDPLGNHKFSVNTVLTQPGDDKTAEPSAHTTIQKIREEAYFDMLHEDGKFTADGVDVKVSGGTAVLNTTNGVQTFTHYNADVEITPRGAVDMFIDSDGNQTYGITAAVNSNFSKFKLADLDTDEFPDKKNSLEDPLSLLGNVSVLKEVVNSLESDNNQEQLSKALTHITGMQQKLDAWKANYSGAEMIDASLTNTKEVVQRVFNSSIVDDALTEEEISEVVDSVDNTGSHIAVLARLDTEKLTDNVRMKVDVSPDFDPNKGTAFENPPTYGQVEEDPPTYADLEDNYRGLSEGIAVPVEVSTQFDVNNIDLHDPRILQHEYAVAIWSRDRDRVREDDPYHDSSDSDSDTSDFSHDTDGSVGFDGPGNESSDDDPVITDHGTVDL